ncbi:hypothetical protein BGX38DRAFT_1185886 [Terfezia claveryi]|nr:hypothetical protein BGX38DRAFT_1185886 [Terfezia claveryi]
MRTYEDQCSLLLFMWLSLLIHRFAMEERNYVHSRFGFVCYSIYVPGSSLITKILENTIPNILFISKANDL